MLYIVFMNARVAQLMRIGILSIDGCYRNSHILKFERRITVLLNMYAYELKEENPLNLSI